MVSARRLARALLKGLGVTPGGDPVRMYGPFSWYGTLPSTRLDYRAEAGNLLDNSAVMATLGWITRTFPEAPIVVTRRTPGTRSSDPLPDHALTRLLRTPNPHYNGLLLWQATLLSWNAAGNAYWLKVRNGAGQIKELWYEPHMTCRPVWPQDGSAFISGYQVLRQGHWSDPISPADVMHYRNGIDPHNPRLGLSPLASALREVFTDNEASNFTASLVRNMGVPGVVVSPNSPEQVIDDPEGLKRTMMAKFSGDRKGEPLVMAGPTKVDVLSFSPEQMSLEALRNIPEERISALLGIPAIVAGLGAGYDAATYSNYRQAREAAYENNLLPTQRLFAAQLESDLLPELGDPVREQVTFDLSDVAALQEDKNDLYKRVALAYTSGVLKRSEARAALGDGYDDADPADAVYRTDLPVLAVQEKLQEDEPSGTLLGTGSGAGSSNGKQSIHGDTEPVFGR